MFITFFLRQHATNLTQKGESTPTQAHNTGYMEKRDFVRFCRLYILHKPTINVGYREKNIYHSFPHWLTVCMTTMYTRDAPLHFQPTNLFCLPFLTCRFHHVVGYCILCDILYSKRRYLQQFILPTVTGFIWKFSVWTRHRRWDLKLSFKEQSNCLSCEYSRLWTHTRTSSSFKLQFAIAAFFF